MSTNPSSFEVRRLEDLLGELVSRPEEMMPCDLAQLHEALRPGGHLRELMDELDEIESAVEELERLEGRIDELEGRVDGLIN